MRPPSRACAMLRRTLPLPLRASPARSFHAHHIFALQSLVGKEHVLHRDIDAYTVDWTKSYSGGGAVCCPGSTAEVAAVLQYCNAEGIGVVPQGGNTGLVGGGVGRSDRDLILSLRRMNSVLAVDEDSRVIYCEAGCILESLMQAAEAKNLLVPLDLGAKGSCMVGGNVSTNAGGLRVLRYGSMHANVLGLEVVLADGTVVDALRGLRKDNCGYQSLHLFIGAEGTLGVVTKVALALHAKPANTIVALAKVPSFDHIPWLLGRFRDAFGDFLSAFEYMDAASLRVAEERQPALVARLASSLSTAETRPGGGDQDGIGGPLYALVELSTGSGTDGAVFREAVEAMLAGLMGGAGPGPRVQAAVLSASSEQAAGIWKMRESIPVCLMQASRGPVDGAGGKLFKYDVSLRAADMAAFVGAVRRGCRRRGLHVCAPGERGTQEGALELCTFGHVGDGNMHLNILARSLPPGRVSELKNLLDDAVFSEVAALRGSISAEHGVGQEKVAALFGGSAPEQPRGSGGESAGAARGGSRSGCTGAGEGSGRGRGRYSVRSDAELLLMRAVKRALDPNGIMNPGKVLPAPAAVAGHGGGV